MSPTEEHRRHLPLAAWLLVLAALLGPAAQLAAVMTPTPELASWGHHAAASDRTSEELPANQDGIRVGERCSYKPASGRPEWLSRDPIAESGGINIYVYVGNRPGTRVDPLGLVDPMTMLLLKAKMDMSHGQHSAAAEAVVLSQALATGSEPLPGVAAGVAVVGAGIVEGPLLYPVIETTALNAALITSAAVEQSALLALRNPAITASLIVGVSEFAEGLSPGPWPGTRPGFGGGLVSTMIPGTIDQLEALILQLEEEGNKAFHELKLFTRYPCP